MSGIYRTKYLMSGFFLETLHHCTTEGLFSGLCYLQQQMGPDTLVSILVAVAAAFLFIVAVLITLIVLFVVSFVHVD